MVALQFSITGVMESNQKYKTSIPSLDFALSCNGWRQALSSYMHSQKNSQKVIESSADITDRSNPRCLDLRARSGG